MQKVKIIFTIGVGQDTNGNELSSATCKELQTKTFQTIATLYGGYTAKETIGGWVNEGKLIEEKSLQIEVLTETPNIETVTRQAETVAFSLCALWNQNCIVLEIQQTSFDFIYQTIAKADDFEEMEDFMGYSHVNEMTEEEAREWEELDEFVETLKAKKDASNN